VRHAKLLGNNKRLFALIVPNLNEFYIAQAFTPGDESGLVSKAPLMGLNAFTVSHPGVNAWATENSTMKFGHHTLLPSFALLRPAAHCGKPPAYQHSVTKLLSCASRQRPGTAPVG
jgi:hypothetical protein